jgi:hypothetical protein
MIWSRGFLKTCRRPVPAVAFSFPARGIARYSLIKT